MSSHGWNLQRFPNRYWPMPPFNAEAVSSFQLGVLDIRWDNPAILSANTPWQIVGVNIYRSDVGERGPYHRINTIPVGGTFYRDFTDNVLIAGEIIQWDTDWIFKGDGPNHKHYRFRTQNSIVKSFQKSLQQPTGVIPVPSYPGCPPYVPPQGLSSFSGPFTCVYANAPDDVIVTIGGQEVIVDSVFGPEGEVTLINQPRYNPVTNERVPPLLPNETSVVAISYLTNRNVVSDELDRKIFYRLTTVAIAQDPEIPGGLIETPLEYSQPVTPIKVESLDWMWREAVRRNNWILEQGGERVKAFIRKTAGVPCDCVFDARRKAYMKQPKNRCLSCFGTGFVGGYEGPYEIIIAPDDADRRVVQTARGRNQEHSYETWTGPTPLLTQRDLIVKQTNDRYSVGPVRKPTNRGNILQQHFQIRSLDEPDIRYHIPIDGVADLTWPGSRLTINPEECILVYPLAEYGPHHQLDPSEHSPQYYPVGPDEHQATPMNTQKKNISDTREHRGKTQTWESQNYAILLIPFALWLLQAMSNLAPALWG